MSLTSIGQPKTTVNGKDIGSSCHIVNLNKRPNICKVNSTSFHHAMSITILALAGYKTDHFVDYSNTSII